MAFKQGDPVFVKQENGEDSATFQEYLNDYKGNRVSAYVLLNGKLEQVDVKKVLAPKQPGFGIRDLVLINDEHRDAVQGEVIAIGHGPKGQKFYQLRFAPNSGHAVSWYSEDEVFIESVPEQQLKINPQTVEMASKAPGA
jgi:hypothetical protein